MTSAIPHLDTENLGRIPTITRKTNHAYNLPRQIRFVSSIKKNFREKLGGLPR